MRPSEARESSGTMHAPRMHVARDTPLCKWGEACTYGARCRFRHADPIAHLRDLVIFEQLATIVAGIETETVQAVSAGTGSGKTVGIPQYFARHSLSKRKLMVALPTVIATRHHYQYAVAMNPARTADFSIGAGGEVMPTFAQTRVTYGTTQTVTNYLLRSVEHGNALDQYVVMVDEAHHPTHENYMLMGLLNWILKQGVDLRVLIASATPSQHPFTRLQHPKEYTTAARQHPITTHWASADFIKYAFVRRSRTPSVDEPEEDEKLFSFSCPAKTTLLAQALDTITGDVHTGDVLIFVSGEQEAETLSSWASMQYASAGFAGVPCYANLDKEEVDEITHAQSYWPRHATSASKGEKELRPVLHPGQKRKLLFATNVAESSLTLPNVTHVVDTMLQKVASSNADDQKTISEVVISQASAVQRKGRAGRVRPGHYFPLCTESMFNMLPRCIANSFLTMNKARPVLSLLMRGLPARDILEIAADDYTDVCNAMRARGLLEDPTTTTSAPSASCASDNAGSADTSAFHAYGQAGADTTRTFTAAMSTATAGAGAAGVGSAGVDSAGAGSDGAREVPTLLGKKVHALPLSLGTSILFVAAREDLELHACGADDMLFLVLLCAALETYMASSWLVTASRETRRAPEYDRHTHASDVLQPFAGFTDACVVMRVYCAYAIHALEHSGTEAARRRWCAANSISAKFMGTMHKHVQLLSYHAGCLGVSRLAFATVDNLVQDGHYARFMPQLMQAFPEAVWDCAERGCDRGAAHMLVDRGSIGGYSDGLGYFGKLLIVNTVTFAQKTGKSMTVATMCFPIVTDADLDAYCPTRRKRGVATAASSGV